MRKFFTTLGVLAIALLIGGMAYSLWAAGLIGSTISKNSTSTPNGNSGNGGAFSENGLLVRDTPGLPSGGWHFVYEQPGSSAKTVQLQFTSSSRCFIQSTSTACDQLNIPDGLAVIVDGHIQKLQLQVDTLRIISQLSDVHVNIPQANSTVTNPIAISGSARGSWFFEGSFPIIVLNAASTTVGQGTAVAQSDWMTTNYVPFTAQIAYNVTTTQPGTIIFKKDNPSGLPENDRDWRVPVILTASASTSAMRSVELYYYSPKKDSDSTGNIRCSRQGLIPVTRQIPVTKTPIQDTIRELIRGNVAGNERLADISTEFPLENFSLTGASLNRGTLELSFNDPLHKTSGGSCHALILWYQIEATAKQFPGVNAVTYQPSDLFQP